MRAARVPLLTAAGTAVLAVSVALAVTVGPADISPSDVWASLAAHLGLGHGTLTPLRDGIVWDLRMPRTLLAAVCGAGLALCGAVMQSLLRNPLADPFVLGVSSGASTGAVAVIVLGVGGGAVPLSVGAFAGALLAFALVLLLSHSLGASMDRVVLSGVAAMRTALSAADAHRVHPGGDGPYRRPADAVPAGDRAHLDGVADHQPVEAQLAPEQVLEDARAERGRPVRIVGRHQQVGAHHGPHPRVERRPERRQRPGLDLLPAGGADGQVVVGVDGDVPVAGEVFGAGGDARRLQAPDPGGGVPGHHLGAGAEGPYADHRVVGVGVDVRARRVVEAHPGGAQLLAQVGGDRLGQCHVVHGAEGEVAGPAGAGGGLDPGDVPGLLVDGDDQRRVLRAQLPGQPGDLLGGDDVAGEQHDGGESAGDVPQHPVGCLGADEAGLQDGEREPSQLAAVRAVGHWRAPFGRNGGTPSAWSVPRRWWARVNQTCQGFRRPNTACSEGC
ncbi:Vitamin B12 import system permease protein BtuC [Streptomyces fumanus]